MWSHSCRDLTRLYFPTFHIRPDTMGLYKGMRGQYRNRTEAMPRHVWKSTAGERLAPREWTRKRIRLQNSIDSLESVENIYWCPFPDLRAICYLSFSLFPSPPWENLKIWTGASPRFSKMWSDRERHDRWRSSIGFLIQFLNHWVWEEVKSLTSFEDLLFSFGMVESRCIAGQS